jgi:hypothetical protein
MRRIAMVALGVLFYLFVVYLFVKNGVTYEIRSKMIKAISAYNTNEIFHGNYASNEISYDCMEHYFKTVFRLYDFGYRNIVPGDVYEKIKSYL